MAKSFHRGGVVNTTAAWIASGYVYVTPNYSMVSTRQALNGDRPIRVISFTPDYGSGSYTTSIVYRSTTVTSPTFFANSGGGYQYRFNNTSGTTYFGRSSGDGFTTIRPNSSVTWSGGISHTITYEEVPSAPRNISVTPAGGSTVNVTWAAPVDNGGTAITQYVIQASATPDFAVIAASASVAGNVLSGSVSGLSNGSWFIRVLAANAVAANFSTYSPASATVEVRTGPVWTFAGDSSYQVRVTNGGSYSDPAGPITLFARVPAASIPLGQEVHAHIAFYVEDPWNGVSLTAYPSIVWVDASNRVISETLGDLETVNHAETHVFTSHVPLGRPRGAVMAELRVTIPQFEVYPDPNVATDTLLYIDGVMISNHQVPYFDGSFPDSGWFGNPGLSPSYQILGDTEPLFDMATDGGNRILSVAAGEIKEETVQTSVYPLEIDSPIPSDIVPTPLGAYHVLDSNDNAVPADVWAFAGGYVHARPGEEWGDFVFTLFAPATVPGFTGPFRIATRLGNTDLAAIRLSGRGVRDTRKTLRWPTGADASVTTEVGASVDSPAIATLEDAYSAGPWVSQSIGGPNVVLSASVSLKDAQGFGVLPGALIRYRDSQYRVTSVTMNGLQVNITAEWFVRVEESDALWVGDPVEDRDAIWAGRKAKDGVVAPLRTK